MGFPHLIPHGPHYKFYTISYLIFLGFFIPGPALVLAMETLKAMPTAKNGFYGIHIFYDELRNFSRCISRQIFWAFLKIYGLTLFTRPSEDTYERTHCL